MIGGALGLLRRSRVLLALVAVELFWGFGMVTFESLLPVRLAEVSATPTGRPRCSGPAGSAAWLASAAGAALIPLLLRWLGAPLDRASLLRILQGVTVVGMGLFAGPVGVLVAFLPATRCTARPTRCTSGCCTGRSTGRTGPACSR